MKLVAISNQAGLPAEIDGEPEVDPIEYFFDLLETKTVKEVFKYDQCA